MRYHRTHNRRRFRIEALEPRRLLAGDLVGISASSAESDDPAAPFQNPVNRFDVSGDGAVTPGDVLLLVNELNARNVSQEDGTLPDPAPNPITRFFDVNGDNLVTRDDMDDVLEVLGQTDYGDAPSSAQSGLVSSYPTLLAEDGARHITGSLYLGTGVSGDSDGAPTADASGDTDDDGVVFLTPLTVGGSTAELTIESSGDGTIDAWIDFNRDGDWSDDGERIFEGVLVASGTNDFSFDVGSGASLGTTFARFRISPDGVDAPTGRVHDGEVEDYAVEIVGDGSDELNPFVEFSGAITIKNVSGDVVVTDDNGELFRQSLDTMETLTVNGSDQADSVTLDYSGGSIVPQLGLAIDGSGGGDTLVVIGGATIDATLSGLVSLTNLPILDMTAGDASTILLDASVVASMAPTTGVLLYSGDARDELRFADVADWRMDAPIVDGDDFWLTASNQITGEQIIGEVPTHYTNLIDRSDVNNDGKVTANDANAIISELGRRRFSVSELGTTVDPTSLDPYPGVYADQSGNLKVTAIDALRVINELARRDLSEDIGGVEVPR